MTFVLFSAKVQAQNITVVKKTKIYAQQVNVDPIQEMVELKRVSPTLLYDIKYASRENFTGIQLYPDGNYTYLRRLPAIAINKVQKELNSKGLELKIFDAYRPYSVTKKMWELVKDKRYVADPTKGSGHNRGLSVDLTIVDLKTGKELDMGTPFDNFTAKANHNYSQLPDQVKKNRRLLKTVMKKYGFRSLDSEWWHYSWPNNKNYHLLDLSPSELFTLSS